MANGKLKLPANRLIALAAVAGVVAGGVAVYVTGGHSGNNPGAIAGEAGTDACAARAEAAKLIAANATGDVAAMLAADPPQSMQSLPFNDPEGKAITLADRKGKTLLVNLWATWCAPCRAEMPALDALQQGKGGANFEVVAINVDVGDDTKPKKFLAETGVKSLAYYRDNTMGAFNLLKERGLALGLPLTLLVDPQGCLVAAMNGPANWSGADAAKLVDAALGQK